MYDYEFTNLIFISNPTISWSFSPSPPYYYTECASKSIVGGYQAFYYQQSMSKQYTLPNHSSIQVIFTLYLIDSWNAQYFDISFDSTLVSNVPYSTSSSTNICGATYNDTTVNITQIQADNSSNFTLNLQSLITLTNDYGRTISWGIRDLLIYVNTSCPSLCLSCTSVVCNSLLQFASQDPVTYNITCKPGFYDDVDDNRCNICDFSCLNCQGAGPTNCTSCNGNDIFNSTSYSCSFSSKNNKKPIVKLFNLDQNAVEYPEFTGGGVIQDYIAINYTWDMLTLNTKTSLDSTCFFPFYVVGGYKLMDTTCALSKLLNFTMPHYSLSVRFQLFIIGAISGYLQFYVNSNLSQQTISYNGNQTYLVGQKCNSYNLYHQYVYYNQSHLRNSLNITLGLYTNSESSNTYWGINNFILKLEGCYPTCMNCSGPLQTQCTACYSSATLSSNQCICNIGFFLNSLEIPCTRYPCSSCSSCSLTCKTCSLTASHCTSCGSNTYLVGNTCGQCSNGSYVLDSNNTCQTCDSSCANCNVSASNCTSCKAITYLEGNECVTQCSNGNYGSSSDNSCNSCDSSCANCNVSATNCTSCKANTYLEENECVTQCSNGSFGSSSDNTCNTCDSSCANCNVSATNCTSCKANTYLEGNACVTQCSNGTYGSSSDNTCNTCDASCANCNISATNCTSCKANTYLEGNACLNSCPTNTYFEGNVCVTQCSNGMWASSSNNMCKVCDSSCSTCNQSSTNCTSCNTNSYLEASDNLCISCNSTCLTCYKSATNCTSCNVNTYLDSNSCKSSCPAGKYPSISDQSCKICDPSCLTCDISATNCTSCPNNLFLQSGTCVSACLSGNWLSTTDNLCKTCDSSCLNCSMSTTNCTSCNQNTFLDGNTCISQCLAGYWPSTSDNTCKKCDVSCETCSGGSTNANCETCSNGYFTNSVGDCTKNCDINQYFDASLKICQNISYISAVLCKNNSASNVFSLIFINYTDSFLQKIQNSASSSFSLSISNLLYSDYSYNMSTIPNGIFVWSFEFTKTVNESNHLLIVFNQSYLNSMEAILTTQNVSISFSSNVIEITPTLKISSDPTILILTFSDQFQELFNFLNSVSTVTISDFSSQNYNFSIINTSNPLVFHLVLSYNVSLIGIQNLELTFDLSNELFMKTDKQLTTNKLDAALTNYYILSESDQQAIQKTQQTTDAASHTTSSATSAFSLVNSGSSLAYSALLLMNFIKFLKFLNINYPPNALAVFEAQLNFYDIWPSFTINHDDNPCDVKFDYYNVDNYVLNNTGELLIQNICLFFGAVLFNQLLNWLLLKNVVKPGLIKKLFFKIYEFLCWNFVLTMSISCINNFFFYSVINLVFATPQNFFGLFNVCASTILIISNIFLLLFLYQRISIINNVLLFFKIDLSLLGKRHLGKTKLDILADISKNRSLSLAMSSAKIMAAPTRERIFDYNNNNNSARKEKSFININENSSFDLDNKIKISNLKPLTCKKNQVAPFMENSSLDIILNEPFSSTRSKAELKNYCQVLNESLDASPHAKGEISSFSSKFISISAFRKNMQMPTGDVNLDKTPVPLHLSTDFYKELLEKYKILYEDFKQESKMTSIYFVLDLIKFPVISLIIILDRYHPLRQSIFISVITIGMLIFLIAVKPLKSTYMFIQYILNQICVLFCTLSCLVLAYYDQEKDYNQDKRMKIGWIIVYGNLGLIYFISSIMIGYFFLTLYRTGKMIYHHFKKQNANSKVLPFEENEHKGI